MPYRKLYPFCPELFEGLSKKRRAQNDTRSLSLRAPQARSNLLNEKIASSPNHNDSLREGVIPSVDKREESL